MPFEYRKPLKVHPPHRQHGEPTFIISESLVLKQDEIALGLKFISHRTLFGLSYRQLFPTYFDTMPADSGVMIAAFVPTKNILPFANFPGDIDLLIIPFEGNELVLSKTIVIELKAVRAKFSKQGKSPNEFGFSQASALLSLGFPYVGVGHLIVSDGSPSESWRSMLLARVIDGNTGKAELMGNLNVDMMPSDLIKRSYGRLIKHSPDPAIGLLAAYIENDGYWMPSGRAATPNPLVSIDLMDAIADYFYANVKKFLKTLRYPPKP